ncbi:hypothetical protein V9T40_010108 [Parthenolecanium corni]|uniref:Uncharacterized protein n=1 Tax=Parthenolecanium corni TaxID=536013 RepID=A0AAN9TM62_9HEMI
MKEGENGVLSSDPRKIRIFFCVSNVLVTAVDREKHLNFHACRSSAATECGCMRSKVRDLDPFGRDQFLAIFLQHLHYGGMLPLTYICFSTPDTGDRTETKDFNLAVALLVGQNDPDVDAVACSHQIEKGEILYNHRGLPGYHD